MPYVDTEWAVVLEGTLPSSEVWANRWTIAETGVGADLDDATTAFRAFYTSWAGIAQVKWHATMITFRNLVNGTVVQPAWASLDGEDIEAPLPTECAIRVSLTAVGGHKGGPFLAGAGVSTLDADGQMSTSDAGGLRNGLTALMSDLVGFDFALRLDSPTDTNTKALQAARIGRTFDVIRKRRNQVPEAYLSAVVTP